MQWYLNLSSIVQFVLQFIKSFWDVIRKENNEMPNHRNYITGSINQMLTRLLIDYKFKSQNSHLKHSSLLTNTFWTLSSKNFPSFSNQRYSKLLLQEIPLRKRNLLTDTFCCKIFIVNQKFLNLYCISAPPGTTKSQPFWSFIALVDEEAARYCV